VPSFPRGSGVRGLPPICYGTCGGPGRFTSGPGSVPPGEDGGDVLRADAVQVQVDLRRAFDRSPLRRWERVGGPVSAENLIHVMRSGDIG
jgi:hypothetical protein